MKEKRETHSLRFSKVGWDLITKGALEALGSENRRAQYLEGLALTDQYKVKKNLKK